MSDTTANIWQKLDTRLRQLLLQYEELQKENLDLYNALAQEGEKVKQLQAELDEKNKAYALLKTAKMLEIGEADVKDAKNKIAKLIREVDNCIALLK